MNKPETMDSQDRRDRIEKILGEWRAAREEGVAAAPGDVVLQHPDLSEELGTAFRVMDALEEHKKQKSAA